MRDEAEKKMSPTENVVQLSLVNNLKNLLEYKQTNKQNLLVWSKWISTNEKIWEHHFPLRMFLIASFGIEMQENLPKIPIFS